MSHLLRRFERITSGLMKRTWVSFDKVKLSQGLRSSKIYDWQSLPGLGIMHNCSVRPAEVIVVQGTTEFHVLM